MLLEAVPNLSEGRSGPALGRLLATVAARSGVHLLDASADLDHHRSVFTLAGTAGPLLDALEALFARALAELDLSDHRGVHPRFGVVDLAPIVPLAECTMAEAVEAARELAERVGRMGVPALLYGEAARSPARRQLPTLRRELRDALQGNGELAPEAGPPTPHPTAGVAVIGARAPLVAFNVQLATSAASVARRIARRVRESGGGRPGLRALGLELGRRRCAQVSMNLYDLARVDLAGAWEAVAAAAAEEGVQPAGCEIVGLVPESAAVGFDAGACRLEGLLSERLLEPRLRRVGLI